MISICTFPLAQINSQSLLPLQHRWDNTTSSSNFLNWTGEKGAHYHKSSFLFIHVEEVSFWVDIVKGCCCFLNFLNWTGEKGHITTKSSFLFIHVEEISVWVDIVKGYLRQLRIENQKHEKSIPTENQT